MSLDDKKKNRVQDVPKSSQQGTKVVSLKEMLSEVEFYLRNPSLLQSESHQRKYTMRWNNYKKSLRMRQMASDKEEIYKIINQKMQV